MRTFHVPHGIQQAVMCIACLQQPVSMNPAFGDRSENCVVHMELHAWRPRLGRLTMQCVALRSRNARTIKSDEPKRSYQSLRAL